MVLAGTSDGISHEADVLDLGDDFRQRFSGIGGRQNDAVQNAPVFLKSFSPALGTLSSTLWVLVTA